jgi:hypothetical protein
MRLSRLPALAAATRLPAALPAPLREARVLSAEAARNAVAGAAAVRP